MAITITVTIDTTDQQVLTDNLTDVDAWVQNAVTGKVNNCWKCMQNEWTTKLMNDDSFTDPIPSNKAEFVTLVIARADYKTMAEKVAASSP